MYPRLGHENFLTPGNSLYFSPNHVLGEVLSSQIEESPRYKSGAHLCPRLSYQDPYFELYVEISPLILSRSVHNRKPGVGKN